MKGLLRRLSSAVIFVIVMLGGVYGGRYSFIFLFSIIACICLWEFYGLVLARHKRRDLFRQIIGLLMGILPIALVVIDQLAPVRAENFIAVSSILFFPFIFFAFIYELYSHSERPFQNVAFMITGMVYIGIPFALLHFIAFDDGTFRTNTVLGLLLLTWVNDTGAYLVGSRIGRHPLFPRISPKKTWEGTLGGAIITLGIACLISALLGELLLWQWLVVALIVIVFGGIGDLVESMLKRSARAKDSGTILPGHGGLLDRFDAFIFLLPYAAAFILWIR